MKPPPKPPVKPIPPVAPPKPPAVIRYRLLVDVLSNFRDKRGKQIVYARRGDVVKMISNRGGVLAVEDSAGERFPVNIEKLIKI